MLMQYVIYPIFRAKNETVITRPELKDVLKKGVRSHRVVLIYFCNCSVSLSEELLLTDVILPVWEI